MTEVRLHVGGNTDVGRLRDKNQDSILLGPVVFGVADGMGGHQGGEVASALAVDAVTEQLTGGARPTIDTLRRAVEQANETVFERSGTDPDVAGMGTTFVAISLIDDDVDGVHLAIVNVGDSRAYRLADGELIQITDDHSLVGELVRDGRITEEEAEVHPQRNVVTRALGIEPRVAVDDFHLVPADGDRYLLCSDGLTNEVPDVEIASVLERITDPDEAADELVRMANENGGRDNITVVIVDVEGDAPGPGVVPDAEDFSHHPSGDTDAYAPIRDDVDNGPGKATPVPLAADVDAEDEEPSRRARRVKPRVVTLRSIGFVLVVLALIGGGLYLVNDYATNTYHVIIDDDQVVIMKGRPGGFLWLDPTLVEETNIGAEDVLAADRDDLTEGVAQSSLARARRYVSNLRERIAETTPPVTTTTTTTTTTTAPQSGVGSATTDTSAGG